MTDKTVEKLFYDFEDKIRNMSEASEATRSTRKVDRKSVIALHWKLRDKVLEALTRQAQVSDDAVVERVARAICWSANGKDNDCETACLAANECRGALNAIFIRDAFAAIEAMPATNSEAVSELAAAADELARWYGPFNPTKHPPEINGSWLRLTAALAKLGSRAP
jgi:hypothetical protein